MRIKFLFFLYCFSFFCVGHVFAETTPLRGQLTLQNSGGQPVQGAEVAAFGANLTVTNSLGQFEIQFVDKKPGSTVRLTIKKTGLEIVNHRELEVVLRIDPDDLVLLVMCKAGERDKNARIYYGIARDTIIDQYEEKIALIKDDVKNKNEIIAKLASERDAALEQAKDLSERFAEVNLDTASKIYKEAFSYFKEGNIEKALLTLDDKKLDKSLNDVQKNIERADERLKELKKAFNQSIDNYMLKADLSVANLQFEEADKNYRKAINADPTNVYNLFIFSLFSLEQKQYSETEELFQKILPLAKDSYLEYIACSLLGGLYVETNQYSKALETVEKGVESFLHYLSIEGNLSWLGNNPGAIRLAVAMINRLAYLYEEHNQPINALKYYEIALAYYKQFAEDNLSEIANIQRKIGRVTKDNKYFQDALENYQKDLNIKEDLAKKDPDKYIPDVLNTLEGMFELYLDMKQYQQALRVCEQALNVVNTTDNPQSYLLVLAENLQRISVIYVMLYKYTEALDANKKALSNYRELAKNNPLRHIPKVAQNLWSMGTIYRALGEKESSLNAYKEALNIYEYLAEKNPDAYLPKIADTNQLLGKLYKLNKQFPNSLKAYKNALVTYEKLSKEDRNFYLANIGLVLSMLSVLYFDVKQDTESIEAYNQAMKIYEELEKKVPDEDSLSAAGDNLRKLGASCFNNKQYTAASKAYQKSVDFYRILAEEDSQTYDLGLAEALIDFFLFHYNLLQIEPTESSIKYGLELAEEAEIFLQKYPNNPKAKENFLLVQQAKTYFRNNSIKKLMLVKKAKDYANKGDEIVKNNGPIQKAEEYYKKAIEDYELIIKKEKDFEYLTALSSVYENLYKLEGSKIENVNHVFKLIEELCLEYKNDAKLKRSLAIKCGSIAWHLLLDLLFEKAEKYARKGLTIDSSQEWIKSNLAHSYLFRNQYSKAETIYKELKGKSFSGKSYKEVLLEDFKALKEAGITHPDVFKVIEFIKQW